MIIDIKDVFEIQSNTIIAFDSFRDSIIDETEDIYYKDQMIIFNTNPSKDKFNAEFDMDIECNTDQEIKIGLFVNETLINASQRTVPIANEDNEFYHINISSRMTGFQDLPLQIGIKNMSNIPIRIKNLYYEIE
jgi:hypothetical protein